MGRFRLKRIVWPRIVPGRGPGWDVSREDGGMSGRIVRFGRLPRAEVGRFRLKRIVCGRIVPLGRHFGPKNEAGLGTRRAGEASGGVGGTRLRPPLGPYSGGSGMQSPSVLIWELTRKVFRFSQLFFITGGIVPSSRTFVTW